MIKSSLTLQGVFAALVLAIFLSGWNVIAPATAQVSTRAPGVNSQISAPASS